MESVVDKKEREWSRHYAALLEYYKEHGTCDVSVTFGIYECDLPDRGDDGGNYHYSEKLGVWLFKQRQYKKDGNIALTRDHEAKLQLLVDEGN